MRTRHVQVAQLTVGDVLADGSEVTAIGPSSIEYGARFVALRTTSGHIGTTLMPDTLVQVQQLHLA